jgi:CRISPR-associated protein Cmr3
MSTILLQLTAHDPIIARDGRPFGINQGQRMRGLPWPLPSVVAGSFRTALVKANLNLDFSGDMPQKLLAVEVAGVFPIYKDKGEPHKDKSELYLPAPNDAVTELEADGKKIKTIHRVTPQPYNGGCDFPNGLPLSPVMLPDGIDDFKPADMPAWWPSTKYAEWLTTKKPQLLNTWFSTDFLNAPKQEYRDHVSLDAELGAAAEGMIFSTAGLNLTHLPRFGVSNPEDKKIPWQDRFAEITLSARVTVPEREFNHAGKMDIWHPLGGERRLVHWKKSDAVPGWKCPSSIQTALATEKQVRMILATPAIFKHGWLPGWLINQLEGSPPGVNVKLRLVGVSNGRWKAVSGWSLAPPRGPKPIRRMVPAGSVYFFKVLDGDVATLTDRWLQSVSDEQQDQRDGFGLALWGVW